jgi:hypothetical protein
MRISRPAALLAATTVLSLGAFAGTASATDQGPGTLTVHLSCGCVLFNDPNLIGQPGAIAIQGGLPVGAAGTSAAVDNPSGVAVFTSSTP